jgi:hypothetical protein
VQTGVFVVTDESSDRLVLLGTARDEIEANVWRDVLAREGISSSMKRADALSVLGAAPPPGSLEIYVQARDEKRARWLLGDALGIDPPPE